MDRETVTLTTKKSKAEVVLKAELTRGEVRQIQTTSIGEGSIPATGKLESITPEQITNQENALISNIVISINGDKDVLKAYDNLPNDDALEILDKANEVFEPPKKKSET